MLSAVSDGEWCQYEVQIKRNDNRVLDVEITSVPLVADGNIVGVTNTCRDISDQKKQKAELALLQQAIEASPNGISISDARQDDTPVVHVNKAFCQITGYNLEETRGQNLRFLQGEETSPAAVSVLRRAVQTQTSCEVKLLNYRKDGTLLWTRMAIGPIFNAAGQCTHFIGTQQDITAEVNQAAKIAYQASYDPLTGLMNRSAFDDRVERSFQWCRQNERLMAVLHLDLDGFKAINDSLGYNVGNQLLVAVAERLQSLIGPHDTLAYFSGDEFVVLMTDIEDFSEVVTAAERILRSFESSFWIEGYDLHVTTSIGVASSDESLSHASEFLRRADKAVDRAKWQGRNTWQRYRETQSIIFDEHIMLRHDLHAALRNDEFELYYQPIVEAHTGRIRSAEALIRWHHPTRGIVSPGIFIPIAEQTGQIIALGRWILKKACQTFADLNAKGYRVGLVSVNISALQFHRDGFIGEVQNILAETGLPAELLELEITESVLFNEADNAIAMLRTLREMKIAIAIDDFGTGFSSLSYLRDLPISKVKLDRTFIQNITDSPSDSAIVEGIITMAHKMDLTVVAEGIETYEQRQDMVNRKCDLLQGFLFSRPVSLNDLVLLPEQLPATD
ncbi:MAG: EAL domain-containing protein [Halomonas sp.]|nr:EAL domain-containing protein [Halomonas sp.]